MVEIIPYTTENKHFIKTLNVEWLQKYFYVEPIDETVLGDPEGEILAKGGFIFYAQTDNHHIVGTASLLKTDDTTYELSKMAVTPAYQGRGISNALMEHCIAFATEKKAAKLILYSNTILAPAIKLYEKYGFVAIPIGSSNYARTNIKMELPLQ